MIRWILGLCQELRAEGVRVGTAEFADACAALEQVPWTDPVNFRVALASTLAKSPRDREVFEAVFDRYLFRSSEQAALDAGAGEAERRRDGLEGEPAALPDPEAIGAAVREALAAGDRAALNELARLAIELFDRAGDASGVVGVDVQRIRRSLGLSVAGAATGEEDGLDREQLAPFERELRLELSRQQIERRGKLPPARALSDLHRSLPTRGARDQAEIHRAVTAMKRRLATLGSDPRGLRRGRVIDLRRTLRSSLETGGVPLRLRYRPQRPRKPEIYVLCDVSTSVSSASTFFLSVLHALHDSFRRLRSFVFIERIAEVTDVFERERDFDRVSERIAATKGVADVSGYTDYGRVWQEFLEDVSADLGPRSTVIVLGDARTNGRAPAAEAFARIAERAGRTFWLNPEPKLYWDYGDSVMSAYAPAVDGVFECWTTTQLEEFVEVIAGREPVEDPGFTSRTAA